MNRRGSPSWSGRPRAGGRVDRRSGAIRHRGPHARVRRGLADLRPRDRSTHLDRDRGRRPVSGHRLQARRLDAPQRIARGKHPHRRNRDDRRQRGGARRAVRNGPSLARRALRPGRVALRDARRSRHGSAGRRPGGRARFARAQPHRGVGPGVPPCPAAQVRDGRLRHRAPGHVRAARASSRHEPERSHEDRRGGESRCAERAAAGSGRRSRLPVALARLLAIRAGRRRRHPRVRVGEPEPRRAGARAVADRPAHPQHGARVDGADARRSRPAVLTAGSRTRRGRRRA